MTTTQGLCRYAWSGCRYKCTAHKEHCGGWSNAFHSIISSLRGDAGLLLHARPAVQMRRSHAVNAACAPGRCGACLGGLQCSFGLAREAWWVWVKRARSFSNEEKKKKRSVPLGTSRRSMMMLLTIWTLINPATQTQHTASPHAGRRWRRRRHR